MIPALLAVVGLLVVLRLDVLLDHFLRNKK